MFRRQSVILVFLEKRGLKALAHKLARACYYVMKDGTTFDVDRCFA